MTNALNQLTVALAADARNDRRALAKPRRKNVANLRAAQTPLFPVANAHTSAQPFVQFGNRPIILRDAEIADPAALVLPELVESVLRRHSPGSPPSIVSAKFGTLAACGELQVIVASRFAESF